MTDIMTDEATERLMDLILALYAADDRRQQDIRAMHMRLDAIEQSIGIRNLGE